MENNAAPAVPPPAAPAPQTGKKRHGCLTTWMILILIGCVLSLAGYLAGASFMVGDDRPGWYIPVNIIIIVIQIISAIAILKWKKWGFWGFVVATVISVIIGFTAGAGMGIATIVGGIIGIAILYGVLHIGKENKGWPQLE